MPGERPVTDSAAHQARSSTGCTRVNDAANAGAPTSQQVRREFPQVATRQEIIPARPATSSVALTSTSAPTQSSLGVRSSCAMPDQYEGFKAEPDGLREQMRGLGSGYDEIAAEVGRRYPACPDDAGRLADRQTVGHAAAQPGVSGAAGVPGLRLVIGVDGDPRAWVQVANALLDCIASGAVRAGSRVPPVTGLGVDGAVAPGAAGRAFRVLASEGVLRWVPGLGYHVRTSITVPVSAQARQDGGLTALLPDEGERQQAKRGMLAGSGAGDR